MRETFIENFSRRRELVLAATCAPSLSELIASVETLRNLAGNNNGVGLTGFKEVLDISDRINALRGNGTEDDSWLGLLKSVAPELAQVVTQVLLARNGSAGAAPAETWLR